MQVAEALCELDLLAVDVDRAIRGLLSRFHGEGQVARFDRQKPPDIRVAQLQISGASPILREMHFTPHYRSEKPQQEVEEVDADVHHDAARTVLRSLPR